MAITVEAQAFILVTAAGLCTMLGASVVFFPSFASLAKPNILAMALSFAAGIMLYISMIDIWGKSVEGYGEDFDRGDAVIYGTLTFFGGAVIMLILDFGVDKVLEWDMKRAQANGSANIVHGSLMGSTREDGDALNRMREEFEAKVKSEGEGGASGTDGADAMEEVITIGQSNDLETAGESCEGTHVITTEGEAGYNLQHMSWAMAAAIAIHNFPEGMVTYLAYIQEPSVGIALAIGIAIHNVPEGLCVAMPLYHATGNRWYAFMWGTLSGLTEPIGAFLVYLVLQNGMSGTVNGALFGIVGGMMTVIAIDELLPTAHRYTSNPKHVTLMVLFGMFFIASSLMLFEA